MPLIWSHSNAFISTMANTMCT